MTSWTVKTGERLVRGRKHAGIRYTTVAVDLTEAQATERVLQERKTRGPLVTMDEQTAEDRVGRVEDRLV